MHIHVLDPEARINLHPDPTPASATLSIFLSLLQSTTITFLCSCSMVREIELAQNEHAAD